MDPIKRRRVWITAIATAVVVVALVGVGVYGLLRGPGTSDTEAGASSPSPAEVSPSPRETGRVPKVAASTDPVKYASSVAEALFEWETGAGIDRSEYLANIAEEISPVGEEGNGLVADLDNYYPTVDQWRQLLSYDTAQYLTITDAGIPDSWGDIADEYADQLTPGTVAVTIYGDRYRTGTWMGEETESVHEVAFTVFVLCPEDAKSCQLLRLSGLDTPLE